MPVILMPQTESACQIRHHQATLSQEHSGFRSCFRPTVFYARFSMFAATSRAVMEVKERRMNDGGYGQGASKSTISLIGTFEP
jgi:hypothetical protein